MEQHPPGGPRRGLVGDLATRQRFVRARALFFVPATVLAGAVLTRLLPPVPGPVDLPVRVALALQAGSVAALPTAAAIAWVGVRRFRGGAHNPLLGEEDERLRIHIRVLQNHPEQGLLFAAGAGAAALALPAEHLHAL